MVKTLFLIVQMLNNHKVFFKCYFQIDLCKLYILFATGFGGKRLRPFQAKIKYETAYNNVS